MTREEIQTELLLLPELGWDCIRRQSSAQCCRNILWWPGRLGWTGWRDSGSRN